MSTQPKRERAVPLTHADLAERPSPVLWTWRLRMAVREQAMNPDKTEAEIIDDMRTLFEAVEADS